MKALAVDPTVAAAVDIVAVAAAAAAADTAAAATAAAAAAPPPRTYPHRPRPGHQRGSPGGGTPQNP